MFGGELAADVILAPHPVEGAARAAPADEVEAGRLRLRAIVPRRAVAGGADDDHRVGEPAGADIGAAVAGIFLQAEARVQSARLGRGGDAPPPRETRGVYRADEHGGRTEGD